jgi:hypothetical protein
LHLREFVQPLLTSIVVPLPNTDWPAILTHSRTTCLERPHTILARSNGWIENYNYCYKPGLLRFLLQNPNLTLFGSYHKAEPYHIVWFRFSPNLSHILGTCPSHVFMFSHLLKSVTHVPHHGIHSFHHLRHGLHLEFKYIKKGGYISSCYCL